MRGMTTASTERAARTFETIGVIGLGTMGAGIAEVFARNGFTVVGVELTEEAVERGREHLAHSTGRAVVWSGHKEQAELYWEQLRDFGLTMAPLDRL